MKLVAEMAFENQVEEKDKLLINKDKQLRKKRRYLIIKRTNDIICSTVALIVLLPIMLIIALLIVIDDPKGGPIFTQLRCGKDGKLFKFYKFRSMCVDAEAKLEGIMKDNEMDGPAFKIKDDPRVTRIGKFLRKTSLDELPQLINIWKGDMTIVGPRPPLPREVEQYNSYQKQRLYVTPGLTCYWQIQPNRNGLDFDKWMELDVKYIKECNFWLDYKIIFLTIKAVIFGYGE